MHTPEYIMEFHKIKEQLCGFAVSQPAKERLEKLAPYLGEGECRRRMEETTGARRILDTVGPPPLSAMKEIVQVLTLSEKGYMLTPEQLEYTATFIASCKRMKGYLKKAEAQQADLASYGQSICDHSSLQGEIDSAIQNGVVQSTASTDLRDIRRKIDGVGAQVKKKLEDLLRGKKQMFSDGYVSQRNGRYVLPVKREYKNQIPGTVVDVSGTGGTCFIEPAAATKLLDELNTLRVEEDCEINKILYTLTALVDSHAAELKLNIEAMTALDVLFAKAKLSLEMDAIPVPVGTGREIKIRKGRHPLLRRGECVPLDFSIGGEVRGIVITGPNTGGKTVALKTVGLLSMMAQSGLHVPVESGRFSMHNLILCDIGDGQSITENLSTFSSHITNIIDILARAGKESLVLLDELGSGTDPAEGMGIAVAILEELRKKNCLFIATTHYPEVKEYAAQSEGLINARMAFDRESLKPLYRLEIGEAGESCALYIAKRLGFPAHMLTRAHRAAYGADRNRAQNGEAGENAKAMPELPEDFAVEGAHTPSPGTPPPAAPSIRKEKPVKKTGEELRLFQLGDSVIVNPEQKLGLVFQSTDNNGQVGVQVQGRKFFVNYKRVVLKTPASELYPPDYDFSIIFDTVENRKARHNMGKRHIEGLVVRYDTPNA